MEEDVMILKMKDGTLKKYKIVLSYASVNNNKYIIFTDNETDIDGNTILYAKKYNSELEKLEDITDEEEWTDVEKKIDGLLIKGDNDVVS